MSLQTIRDVVIKNQRVLIRLDLDVPLDEKGRVTDFTRIEKTLPTLQYLLEQGAKQLVILGHLDRPEGKKDKALSTAVIVTFLEKQLKQKVGHLDNCVGIKLPATKVVVLENLRFHPEEESKTEKIRDEFAKKLARTGDLYVNEAFAVSHRDQASVTSLPKFLPAVAGLYLAEEVRCLEDFLKKLEHPVTLIIGGAKVETKLKLIRSFYEKADCFIFGGALANTFLAAEGHEIGQSLHEQDKLELAQEILMSIEGAGKTYCLPQDVKVADRIVDNVITVGLPVEDLDFNMLIGDIGPKTIEQYMTIIQKSKTVILNGPLGVFEKKPFEKGTKLILEAIASSRGISVIGGGDTLEALRKFKIPFSRFSHVSLGGGALLEMLAEGKLVGVEAIKDKKVIKS